tara:strand:+ start:217 stop:480 length:264 start_codon:yes stop_codon:yes gene_type:complete
MKTIKNLSVKFATNYINYNYGTIKHDIKQLIKASRQTAKDYKTKPLYIFFFIIENQNIPNLIVNSYNYNTRLGREIKENFKYYYYNN